MYFLNVLVLIFCHKTKRNSNDTKIFNSTRTLTMFLQTLNLVCNPLKNLDYLQGYFNTVRVISLKENAKTRQIYCILMILTAYKCVHFLALGLFSKNFTDYERLVHYDALHLIVPKYRYSFYCGLWSICMLFYNYILFVRPNVEMNNLLKSILVENQTSDKRKYFLGQLHKRQNVVEYIRNFCLKVLTLFSSFILVVGKSFLLYIFFKLIFFIRFISNLHRRSFLL